MTSGASFDSGSPSSTEWVDEWLKASPTVVPTAGHDGGADGSA